MEAISLSQVFDQSVASMSDADRIDALQALQKQMATANRVLTGDEICLLMLNLGHTDFRIREECLLTLNDCSRATGRIAALTLLLDEEWLLRDRALEELEFTGTAQDQYAVERLLKTETEWPVRASAVSCLAGIGGAQAKPAIVKLLHDENSHVRRYASNALARVGDASDVAVLLEAEANEQEVEAKIGIYGALYRLGNGEYLHKLIDLVAVYSPDEDNQILVLGAFTEYVFPGDNETVRSYLETIDLENAHPDVRERAAQLLERLNAD